MISDLVSVFQKHYGRRPTLGVRAPGRVNLIGEHTDYTQGLVMPCAIDREMVCLIAPRTDRQVQVISGAMGGGAATFSLDELDGLPRGEWWSYVAGVAWALGPDRLERGFDGVWGSSIPVGSGLSSSAALELTVALALDALHGGLGLSRLELALLCQRAEGEYVGVKCGVMDQLAVALGQEGRALLIDCRSLQWEPVEIPSWATMVIIDSGKPRTLAASAYNQRRRECEEALALLQRHRPDLTSLRDLEEGDLHQALAILPPTHFRRVRHVVTETHRVLASRAALTQGQGEVFGELMNQSHDSLRYDYEVSSPELDGLVEACRTLPSVLGARLTGAGFGGCVIGLVEGEVDRKAFARAVEAPYGEVFGRQASVMVSRAAEGACLIEEPQGLEMI